VNKEAYITKRFFTTKPWPQGDINLSIFISPAAFMYAILKKEDGEILELGDVDISFSAHPGSDLTEKIAFQVNNHMLLKRTYSKIQICILNRDFTLIPEAYAVEKHLASILKFSTGSATTSTPFRHSLSNISFCYTVEHQLLSYLERTFNNASIRHAGASSIALMLSQHSLTNSDVFTNISNGLLEVVYRSKNEISYYNVFTYESDEDILYYLLFIITQFKLEPQSVRLAIAAERQSNDGLIKSLKKYVRNVSFCVTDATVRMSGELSEIPHHYYFTLLNQHLCEL
jgi:hypothetical protein